MNWYYEAQYETSNERVSICRVFNNAFFPTHFFGLFILGKGLISQKNSVQPELTLAVDFDATFYLFLNCSELLLILMIIFHQCVKEGLTLAQ